MPEVINVRIFVGAAAYACITTNERSLDLQLAAGKSPAQSLRDTAKDLRMEAARLSARAKLADEASVMLERSK